MKRLHKRNHLRLGFTLLELLIVISIIAVLIGLSTVSFSTAQRRGRDAKRRGDMKSMQNAFEQYYSANNSSYAVSCATMVSIGGTQLLPNGLPVDPRTQANYPCAATATSYCVCSLLEGAGGNSTSANCAFAASGTYFCMSNLQ